MSARRVLWIVMAVAVVVGVAFVPIRTLNCPAWNVWVTDQSGQPVSSMTVRLLYQKTPLKASLTKPMRLPMRKSMWPSPPKL